MEKIMLQHDARLRQTLVAQRLLFSLCPEGVLLTAENAPTLQAAAQEWMHRIFEKLPEHDELIPCPPELAERAVFPQQREVDLSLDLKRCDDPYLRILARPAKRRKGYPVLDKQQILLINQFEAILIVGLRCYPVFASGGDDSLHPDCDLVASVWVYPSVAETQFWDFYRSCGSHERHETTIVSFPLNRLEKAHQAVLARCQERAAPAPDLHLALVHALQHTCPTPLRGCQCFFYAICPGCHENRMHMLQDLLKYELAGGLCFACQGNTYVRQREK